MNSEREDKLTIRDLVENWVVWRDSGDWERFATVWHSDGWMTATWFQGPAQKFIEVSREGFNKGANILHLLGGWTCEIVGDRAISQVKMTINQRAPVEGVLAENHKVKIVRRDNEIGEGRIVGLEAGKAKTHEVPEGKECGIQLESKIEVSVGDILESITKITR